MMENEGTVNAISVKSHNLPIKWIQLNYDFLTRK